MEKKDSILVPVSSAPSAGSGGFSMGCDPGVPGRALCRRFSAQYKPRILREADHCKEPGRMGALLRREGLKLIDQFRRVKERPYCNHFWENGCCVDTAGLDADMTRKHDLKIDKTSCDITAEAGVRWRGTGAIT